MRVAERDMLLGKIEEWKTKALRENDPFNKYLSAFIAHNIFYNLYKKTEHPSADLFFGDSERAIEVRKLIDDNGLLFEILKPELEVYVGFIPTYNEEYWGKSDTVGIAKGLSEAFNKEDVEQTLDLLLKWLYKVRCNLVHGEKNYNDERQKNLLKQSSSLLIKILTHLLKAYRETYVYREKKDKFL